MKELDSPSVSEYIGKTYKTKNSGSLRIVWYRSYKDVDVVFSDTGYTCKTNMRTVKNGQVEDRLIPSVCGVGCLGYGAETKVKGKFCRWYRVWYNMLRRCYSEKQQVRQPTYYGCSVSENFKNFSFFSNWCQEQVGASNNDWCLDKDLLVKGNKVYSEDTCVFLPTDINGALVKNDKKRGDLPVGVKPRSFGNFQATISLNGYIEYIGVFDTVDEAFLAYKKSKESYLCGLANYWKGRIDDRAYNALKNYKVEKFD